MAKKWSFDWLNLIPGYGIYRSFKNISDNIKKDGFQASDLLGWYGMRDITLGEDDFDSKVSNILGYVQDESRQEYLQDREHQEQREDTAYQRGVADMQAAGLNPYTIGSNPAPSSASNVGANSIGASLQMLGYILDLKNLDLQNKNLVNNIVGNLVKAYASKTVAGGIAAGAITKARK